MKMGIGKMGANEKAWNFINDQVRTDHTDNTISRNKYDSDDINLLVNGINSSIGNSKMDMRFRNNEIHDLLKSS